MAYAIYASGSFANYTTLAGAGGVAFRDGPGTLSNHAVIQGMSYQGVLLGAGGQVTNQAGASITGFMNGVAVWGGAGTVDNSGVVTGGQFGVYLQQGGLISNTATGTITGSYGGVVAFAVPAAVVNSGSITSFYQAISLYAGGSVTNCAGGYLGSAGVFGSDEAVLIVGASASVSNSGTIVGGSTGRYSSGRGVRLIVTNAASVDNAAHGQITGGIGVYVSGAAGTVSNYGVVDGTLASGVDLAAGGSVANGAGGVVSGKVAGIQAASATNITNAAGATISGYYGVLSSGRTTLLNAGSVVGTSGTAASLGAGSRVIIDPGAAFGGDVLGGGGSCLELAVGTACGVLVGLGSQFTGFSRVLVDPAAIWRLAGPATLPAAATLVDAGVLRVSGTLADYGAAIVSGRLQASVRSVIRFAAGLTLRAGANLVPCAGATIEIGSRGGAAAGVVTVDAGSGITGAGTVRGSVVDDGTLSASGGTLAVLGNIVGAGAVSVAAGAAFAMGGSDPAARISFLAGGHATVSLGMPKMVGAAFGGFVATDTIDLVGFVADSLNFTRGALSVHRAGGSSAVLQFSGSYATGSFAFGADGQGGTSITRV